MSYEVALILLFLGKYVWIIVPLLIWVILEYQEKVNEKELSKSQKNWKKGSVIAFVIMALLILLSKLSGI